MPVIVGGCTSGEFGNLQWPRRPLHIADYSDQIAACYRAGVEGHNGRLGQVFMHDTLKFQLMNDPIHAWATSLAVMSLNNAPGVKAPKMDWLTLLSISSEHNLLSVGYNVQIGCSYHYHLRSCSSGTFVLILGSDVLFHIVH
jgi:hypothetical protein